MADRRLTAKEFYDSIEDKTSYYWIASGQYTYEVLVKWEDKKKEVINKNKLSDDEKDRARRFKEWQK